MDKNKVNLGSEKFISQTETIENDLKRKTIGLVKLEDFQRIKDELNNKETEVNEKKSIKTKKKKNLDRGKLSFGDDDEEEIDFGMYLFFSFLTSFVMM